jgi:putative sigma-54 modulation protein
MHASLDKTSGNVRAARERAGLREIDAMADRPTHFTLRRTFHCETTSAARPCPDGGLNTSVSGANTDLLPSRRATRGWNADCDLTYQVNVCQYPNAGGIMELSIKTHGLDLSDALKAYTERRLRFSLGGFVTQLDGVEVRLGDINGPRGGIDKTCAIKVILRRFGVVFARAAGHDVYSTVDDAAARIRAAVSRTVSRRRARR